MDEELENLRVVINNLLRSGLALNAHDLAETGSYPGVTTAVLIAVGQAASGTGTDVVGWQVETLCEDETTAGRIMAFGSHTSGIDVHMLMCPDGSDGEAWHGDRENVFHAW